MEEIIGVARSSVILSQVHPSPRPNNRLIMEVDRLSDWLSSILEGHDNQVVEGRNQ
jgi:hypothetical protein